MVTLFLAGGLCLLLVAFAPVKLETFKSWTDMPFLLWCVCISAWPIVTVYFVAPMIWPTAESAGPLFPLLQYTPALAVTAVLLWKAVTLPTHIHVPALLLALLLTTAAVSLWLTASGGLINILLALALLSGTIFKTKNVHLSLVTLGSRLSLILIFFFVLLSTVINQNQSVADCRIDKCGQAGMTLTSPFAGNGNLAGLTAALLVPFAVARLSPTKIILACLAVALFGEVAASRTATIGIAVGGGASLLISLCRSTRAKMVWSYIGLSVGLTASLLPLYAAYGDTDYSLRGYLWNEAKALIAASPMFGYGPTYWITFGKSSLFEANYSPHNGWFDTFISIGAVGVLVLCVCAALVVYQAATEERPFILAYYGAVLSVSALESVYVPYNLGITPFVALLPLMLYTRGVRILRDGASRSDFISGRTIANIQPIPDVDHQ